MFESITAEQLLASLGDGNIVVLLMNLAAFIAGLGAHVWQKMRTESITFKQYWTSYGMNSFASLAALATTFMSMTFMAPEAPLYAYFSMAFMGDAMLNKPPVNVQTGTRGLKEDFLELKDEAADKLDDLKDQVVAMEKVEPLKVWGAAAVFVFVVLAILV